MSKIQVAKLSIISNTSLIIMKLIVGVITGSVSIISEAIHSTMDLLASLIAFISVKISDKPADLDHPYGHGKVENISGVIEALLILSASILIIIEAINKIRKPERIGSIDIGFLVMFVSAGINYFVSRKIYKVAKQEDSMALEADALHLKADVYTSLGVGTGLLLIWITGMYYLDPIVAIIVSIFILKEASELLKSAFNPLLDATLSQEEISIIEDEINEHKEISCNFHNLRTRKSGRTKYVDLHLVVPENMYIKDAHSICDAIENAIEETLKFTEVMIHLESCEEACNDCPNKEKCKLLDAPQGKTLIL